MVVLCRSRLELQQHAISTKVGRKLKMLMKQHFRNGISYLPQQCFEPLVTEGKLTIIQTTPALPPVPYAAMYRSDRPSAFISAVAMLALEVCDFSRQLQS
jgi:hypothetical protein